MKPILFLFAFSLLATAAGPSKTVILDENGAERLIGMGDLLYRPPGTSKLVRAQGVLVTDEETEVEYVGESVVVTETDREPVLAGEAEDEIEVVTETD
jgi:DNA segregation ATPase FtsK/SpoIIIE-like protein